MDINTEDSSGMMNGMPPSQNPGGKGAGAIVGALIIVLIIILVALYFFGKKLNTQSPAAAPVQNSYVPLQTTSQADDIQSIQTDLDNQMQDVDYSF